MRKMKCFSFFFFDFLNTQMTKLRARVIVRKTERVTKDAER